MTDGIATVYYDRASGRLCQEKVLGDKWLRLAYCSAWRGVLKWPLFCCGLFSRLMGWYLDRRCSVRRIGPVIRELNIDMGEAEVPPGGYSSFNDFFSRRLRPGSRPLPENEDALLCPADCRLTVYPLLQGDAVVPVKGASYTVHELIGAAAGDFAGGALMVCRLCPADYHRFHVIDDSVVLSAWRIRGKYHTVNPLALESGLRVFTENLREVVILESRHARRYAFVPVGAFGVASIHNFLDAPGRHFARGEEAGYFTFGGSTVIVAFPAGTVAFDADIVENSAKGVETLVKANSAIGSYAVRSRN